ncbi:MAG: ABC transporter permease, partial [bacterium]|nr:ABC transporter permease [bacterium]
EIVNKLKPLVGEKFRTSKDYINKLREVLGVKIATENEFFLTKFAIQFKERASIVLTFLNNEGDLSGGKFRVAGIYKTKNSTFDEMSVFVNKNDLSRLSGYDKANSNELAVLLKDKKFAKDIAEHIREKYPELKVETWAELNPELVMLSEYVDIYNYIIIGFILAALAFGIINTMLMAIMERTKEIGMLAAIGMVRGRIFRMILLETVFLTLTGAIVGLITNSLIMSRLSIKGIDFSKTLGEGFEAMGYDSVIYPEMGLNYYIGTTILVVMTGILSSIYPAIKAIKLNPADAVRTDA